MDGKIMLNHKRKIMSDKFYKWNKDNVFFLTKEGHVEVTAYGHPKLEDGSLYWFADQSWHGNSGVPDGFGRNQIDIWFVQLCNTLFGYLMCKEETFRLLSCKKDNDRYIARLELTDETLEMELGEMVELLEKRVSEPSEKCQM
jgi:hypothetical protein